MIESHLDGSALNAGQTLPIDGSRQGISNLSATAESPASVLDLTLAIPATGFIRNLERITFHFHPEIVLLRCNFDLSGYDDVLYAQLGISCPQNVRSAVKKRKAEYLAGRYLSRILLESRRLSPNLSSGLHRQPLWPSGWVGSITHTYDAAVACLSEGKCVRMLGIDLEYWLEERVAMEIAANVIDYNEENLLLEHWSYVHALTFAFSAKESLFKAVYPEVGYYFDFDHVRFVKVEYSDKCFVLQVVKDISPGIKAGKEFHGSFDMSRRGILTIVTENARNGVDNCHPCRGQEANPSSHLVVYE